MKIIGLRIEGMRSLVAAEMAIREKGLTPIKARNKAGKTTVLDALQIIFEGNTYVEPDMINHQSEKMTIIGKVMGEGGEVFNIKKVITNKSARLEITDEKGFVMSKKPQEFLSSLIGGLTFNPRKFLDLEGDKKLKELMNLLKIDFSEVDRKIKEKEQERLLVGRELKNFGEVDPGDPVEEVNVSAVMEKRQEIIRHNNKLLEHYQEQVRAQQQINQQRNDAYAKEEAAVKTLKETDDFMQKSIEDIDRQIERLQKEREDKIAAQLQTRVALENRPSVHPPVDVFSFDMPPQPEYTSYADLDNQIAEASDINTKAAQYRARKEQFEKKQAKLMEYERLSEAVDSWRGEKMNILKMTKMPIQGLEIRQIPGEEEEKYGLFYNGTYSENWSEAEGLVIASQMCLSQNPKLRAVFLDKGESMDSDTLKAFSKWAEDNDMQVVITMVADVPSVENMEDNTWYIVAGELVTKPEEATGELALD